MCCYKSRKQPSIVIATLSALVLLVGVTTMAFAVKLSVYDNFFLTVIKLLENTANFFINTVTGPLNLDFEKYWNILFGVLLGSGIITFLTGLLGLFFTCCKKSTKCYAVIYGIFLTLTWIFILFLGCIVTAFLYSSQSII
jgi:hypothetical protein